MGPMPMHIIFHEFNQHTIIYCYTGVRLIIFILCFRRRGITLPATTVPELLNLCTVKKPGTLVEFLAKFKHYMHVIA